MRLFIPFAFVALALLWTGYAYFIKKDKDIAKKGLGITAFFSAIWIVIYFIIIYK